MNIYEVLDINEGLVFLKNSGRLERYIKSIQRKTKNIANKETKKFVNKLISLTRKFKELEEEYKTGDKEKIRDKYEVLKAKNDDIIKELNKRTLRTALIIIGIVGAVLAILKLVQLGVDDHHHKEALKDLKPELDKAVDQLKQEDNKKTSPIKSEDNERHVAEIAELVRTAGVKREQEISSFIEQVAKEQGVDPKLVRAVIKVESNWDVNEVSLNKYNGRVVSKDEGLMQLNSLNYKEFKEKLNGGKDYDPLNYRDNIRIGIKHLKSLMHQFNGDIDKAVMAYNAGSTRIKSGVIPPSTIAYLRLVKQGLKG